LTLDDSPKSRADLQSELRKENRKAKRHQHRWRRRILIALGAVLLIAVLGAAGIYEYANYQFNQIKKIHSKHLVAQAPPGQPFTLLFVGSDSRAFVNDNNATQVNAFGTTSDAGGQRSDVTMVARFVPATKTVTVLSIPRDLWVNIPGNDNGISGMNRINAAFDAGPDLLIQTIEQDLGIPINHYVAVGFPGFSGMVDALGGVTMDFPTEVKDQYTGLDIATTGCQTVNGTVALQLVRSRHLYYMDQYGYWQYDGQSDFSRILRQDNFFRAVLAKVNTLSLANPLAVNSFVSAAVGNLTIDDTLSEGDLLHLAQQFKGLNPSRLVTETLPTTAFVTDGGADVLQEAQPYADNMINAFKQLGTPQPKPSPTSTTTTTTTPAVPRSQINVQVLNASTSNGLAHATASALALQGFTIAEIGDASSPLQSSTSVIQYGPDGLDAAHTLGAALNGPITYTEVQGLSAQTVTLLVAGPQLTVTSSAPQSATTANPTPSGAGSTTSGSSTTTTTIPADVVTNTQPEPWNPYPCTLGPATQASPKKPAPTKSAHRTSGRKASTTSSTSTTS
jgi:LCP family protein required for cell wall assembly